MFLQTSVVAVRHSPATAARRGRSTTSVTMLWLKVLESGILISLNLGVGGLYVTSKETENITFVLSLLYKPDKCCRIKAQ